MTKPFLQNLNEIHKELWKKSDNAEISGEEIKKTIKTTAGYTVVDKYFKELENFNRIEQVPETQTWIVTKPEKAGINKNKHTGERKAKQVMIPEEILQAGQQYGVNFSQVMTEALIEEISNIEQFIEDYIGEETSRQEAEFVFEMLKNDLDKRKGRKQKQARRDKRRREIYKEIFDVEKADREHIEKLRKKSFKLGDML